MIKTTIRKIIAPQRDTFISYNVVNGHIKSLINQLELIIKNKTFSMVTRKQYQNLKII